MRKRYSDEDILKLLREIELKLAEGSDVQSACRGVGVSDATYYNWRKRFGGMGQPHPPASGAEHGTTGPANSNQKWPIGWRLDNRSLTAVAVLSLPHTREDRMSRCQPKTVTYRARCYYGVRGRVTWYLAWDDRRYSWRWTKGPDRQAPFSDSGKLIDAIEAAGNPDMDSKHPSPGGWLGNRRVIIETITHEEEEFNPGDHFHWQQKHPS